MTTYRVQRRTRFTNIDRRTVNDAALSFRARGVLVWLLDKPDDWRVTSNEIARQGREGRESVRTALRELEEKGYLVRVREQGLNGRWHTTSIVYERPPAEDGFPGVGEPGVGEPGVGEPGVGEPGAITNTGNDHLIPKTDTEDCQLTLDTGSASPTAKTGGKPKTPERMRAEELVNEWWESVTPKPAQKWIAIVRVIESLAGKGWTVAEIRQALREAPVISGAAFDFWRATRARLTSRGERLTTQQMAERIRDRWDAEDGIVNAESLEES